MSTSSQHPIILNGSLSQSTNNNNSITIQGISRKVPSYHPVSSRRLNGVEEETADTNNDSNDEDAEDEEDEDDDLSRLKCQLAKRLGPTITSIYWSCIKLFILGKISKREMEKNVRFLLHREKDEEVVLVTNVKDQQDNVDNNNNNNNNDDNDKVNIELHNQIVKCIWLRVINNRTSSGITKQKLRTGKRKKTERHPSSNAAPESSAESSSLSSNRLGGPSCINSTYLPFKQSMVATGINSRILFHLNMRGNSPFFGMSMMERNRIKAVFLKQQRELLFSLNGGGGSAGGPGGNASAASALALQKQASFLINHNNLNRVCNSLNNGNPLNANNNTMANLLMTKTSSLFCDYRLNNNPFNLLPSNNNRKASVAAGGGAHHPHHNHPLFKPFATTLCTVEGALLDYEELRQRMTMLALEHELQDGISPDCVHVMSLALEDHLKGLLFKLINQVRLKHLMKPKDMRRTKRKKSSRKKSEEESEEVNEEQEEEENDSNDGESEKEVTLSPYPTHASHNRITLPELLFSWTLSPHILVEDDKLLIERGKVELQILEHEKTFLNNSSGNSSSNGSNGNASPDINESTESSENEKEEEEYEIANWFKPFTYVVCDQQQRSSFDSHHSHNHHHHHHNHSHNSSSFSDSCKNLQLTYSLPLSVTSSGNDVQVTNSSNVNNNQQQLKKSNDTT